MLECIFEGKLRKPVDYQSVLLKAKKQAFLITRNEDARKNARHKAGQKRRIRLGDSQTATTFSSSQSMPEKGPKEQFDQTVCVNKFPAEQAENLGVKMTTLLKRSTTSLLTKPPRMGQFDVLHKLITCRRTV
jgi:hypothetical protein